MEKKSYARAEHLSLSVREKKKYKLVLVENGRAGWDEVYFCTVKLGVQKKD